MIFDSLLLILSAICAHQHLSALTIEMALVSLVRTVWRISLFICVIDQEADYCNRSRIGPSVPFNFEIVVRNYL